ncbi:MAG TPA: hypothetical protein VFV50_02810 [Bdellovibrionales bacterium]|nr:hypothetical protein [Bdellovibrionales bacterium]
MSNPNQNVMQAVEDLALIRRLIDRPNETTTSPRALNTNVLLHFALLAISVMLVGVELYWDHIIAYTMSLAKNDASIRAVGTAQIGAGLGLIVALVYFIVWTGARQQSQSFEDYVTQNFHYLRNLTLVSDMFVKFAAVGLLIMAGHTQAIGALFLVYTADLLIQGRVFKFRVREAMPLGVACLVASGFYYAWGFEALLWPMAVFAGLTTLSFARVLNERRRALSALV